MSREDRGIVAREPQGVARRTGERERAAPPLVGPARLGPVALSRRDLPATGAAAGLAGPRLALARFVHAQRAAAHLKAVRVLNRLLRVGRRHLDKTEAARTA